jgi:outer membrane protein insertion porin family
MDLVFAVEEQPTTELQFGLTFSGSPDPETFPLSGLFKLNDLNFRGSGDQFGVEVNGSPSAVSTSVLYNRRWLFGLPLSGGFDFSIQWSRRLAAIMNPNAHFYGDEPNAYPAGFASFDEYRDADRLPAREFLMNFQQLYTSLGFSTGYRWSTQLGTLSLGGGIRMGLVRVMYDDDILSPFDPTLRQGNNRWVPMNSLFTSVSLDQRDLFFDPSKGYFLSGRFSINGLLPPEREHYIKTDLSAQQFFSLVNVPVTDNWNFKVVLGLQSGLSFITPQPGKELTIEDANKLAIDGLFIGRGWSSEFRNKGYAMWNNWVELRIPLVTGLLAWDFFFDAVGIEGPEEQGNYFENFGIENMRFSMGGGLRFTIPQFPFRLSLASRFRVRNGEVEWPRDGNIFQGEKFPGFRPVLSISVTF